MPTGISHLRYDHRNYVSYVHVICPTCKKRAIATILMHNGETYQQIYFDVCEYYKFKCWRILCESCPFRREIEFSKGIISTKHEKKNHDVSSSDSPYQEIGEFYYKLDDMHFWAYNFDHLNAIVQYLELKLDKNNPYEFIISSYFRAKWKKNKKKLLKLIRRKATWNV